MARKAVHDAIARTGLTAHADVTRANGRTWGENCAAISGVGEKAMDVPRREMTSSHAVTASAATRMAMTLMANLTLETRP